MKVTSNDLLAQVKEKHTAALTAAFKSGDEKEIATAMTAFFEGMNEATVQRAVEVAEAQNQDAAIMAARGCNVLTTAEKEYWNGAIEALKSADPRAAITNYDKAMPQTIIERITGTIKKNHPLLDKINFVTTGYVTRLLVNTAPGNMAKWGKITDAVTKEITGSIDELTMTKCKLSAFMAISQDLLELGAEWVDEYARETMAEVIACGMEYGCVAGTGRDEPVGMIRDLTASINPSTGYAKMTAVPIKKLDPKTVGALCKKLARDPNDTTGMKARPVDPRDIIFVFNPFDYWDKVFGATTRLVNGQYVSNLLPIPAEIFQSEHLEEGEAVIGIASHYIAGVGPAGKTGTITSDDSVRFIQDERAYKGKLQGDGRPMTKYDFLLLDVSGMESVVDAVVEVAGTVSTKEVTG